MATVYTLYLCEMSIFLTTRSIYAPSRYFVAFILINAQQAATDGSASGAESEREEGERAARRDGEEAQRRSDKTRDAEADALEEHAGWRVHSGRDGSDILVHAESDTTRKLPGQRI